MEGLFSPSFERWKKLSHSGYCLFVGETFAVFVVEFVVELGAMLDHLFHCALLCKCSLLVAIDAVIVARRSVGLGAEVCRSLHGHAATLAKFHRFIHIVGFYVLLFVGTDTGLVKHFISVENLSPPGIGPKMRKSGQFSTPTKSSIACAVAWGSSRNPMCPEFSSHTTLASGCSAASFSAVVSGI